jgi:predicted nucleotide-binding protein (sugar kinase/HSP70/actin superfamily)
VRDALWEYHLSGLYADLSEIERDGKTISEIDGRPTVGMQRALYNHQFGLFWAAFFDRLGLRVVFTPKTNDHISRLGIESMTTETCYPVKVSQGHVIDLIGKTRYLFLPNIIDLPSQDQRGKSFYCPMVQGNQYMLRAALNLKNNEVLNPAVHLKYSPDLLAAELHRQIGKRIRASLSKMREAVEEALKRQKAFENDLYKKGAEIVAGSKSDEPIVIVTGRPYNLYDERLNLRLGRNLSKIGMTALPMDFLDLGDIDLSDFPNMYWAYGAQVLKAAKLIKVTPNFFGLHLTNFSCGPDSFNEHFYRYIMGTKPYLILELDEHTAVAGVMTRLEAYKNVIQSVQKIESMKPQPSESTVMVS